MRHANAEKAAIIRVRVIDGSEAGAQVNYV